MEIDKILKERDTRYGSFEDDAGMAQGLKSVLRSHPNYDGLPAPHKEALEMMCTKMGRIVNGDPMYKDNFTDIIGYARLVEQMIEG